MDNLYHQKVINANNVFDGYFLDAKTLYLYCFNQLPSVSFINGIDAGKSFEAFKAKFGHRIVRIHREKQQAAPGMEVVGFRRHLADTTHSLA